MNEQNNKKPSEGAQKKRQPSLARTAQKNVSSPQKNAQNQNNTSQRSSNENKELLNKTVRQPNRPARQPNKPARQPNKPARQPNKPTGQPTTLVKQQQALQPKTTSEQKNKSRQSHYSKRPNSEKTSVPVTLYPLGGLGEIGKNMTVYECMNDMFVIDCGSLFPESDMYGVDLVIPDFTFIEQNKDRIKGVVITHGHEDHIGALPYLLREINLPIYATRLTAGLIENKLEEHGLRASTKITIISPSEKFKIGCFTIDPIHVNHSIPDAVGFAVECPAGILIHTGDFKIDYTPVSGTVFDLAKIADYGKKGVLALLSDSTNSETPGMSASESVVNNNISALFGRAEKQRIIIATFASNLFRVQHIIETAIKSGRKVAISGRSMVNNTRMARELGYIKAPDDVLIDIEHINKYPPESVVLITTGSQGETLSALSRMASNSHRNVKVGQGDFIIISATPIPGNEKMVTRVVNGLLRLGADVIYERMYDVHASGHACQEEQKLIITLANPQYFVPVHGEYKHLRRHAQTAQALGVAKENILLSDTGESVVISKNAIKNGESVQSGAVMVDGLGVGDVGSVVLRDRRLLSQDGIVIVTAVIDSASRQLISPPEILTRGFVYVRESEQLLEETRQAVQKVLENSNIKDINSLKTKVREVASGLLYRKTKRSPMILPIISEV